jgi:hypothetical protein
MSFNLNSKINKLGSNLNDLILKIKIKQQREIKFPSSPYNLVKRLK